MIPKKISAGRGTLLAIKTDKFKTEMLTLTLPLPMAQRTQRLCTLLFSILRRGCKAYPDIASLSRRLDDLYDANIATMAAPTGENFSAGFACECLDSAYVKEDNDLLAGTLDTLRKMLFEPLLDADGNFSQKALELEKRNLCDSIRTSDNDPKIHSFQLCRGIMFEGEPYGKRAAGTVEDVMAVNGKELEEFRREYLGLSSPTFIYIGRRDAEEIKALIEKYFGDFGGEKARLNKTILKNAVPSMRSVEEEMSVLQGKLTLGMRSDIGAVDKDMYAAILTNDIFGGSPSSKLFRNVREKQSLCYSCSSSFDFVKGALFVRSGISNENKDRVIKEILAQFEEIKSGNISDYEFECSKRSIENYYRQASDSAYSMENYYRTRSIAGIDTTLDGAIEAIHSVTKEDVVRAANRFGADTCAFVRGNLGDGKGYEEGDEDE
ncbi:MAG: insulinase family protein [Clostridia bacterium]|nr:insulinase family protein [Clostridia bacterium]